MARQPQPTSPTPGHRRGRRCPRQRRPPRRGRRRRRRPRSRATRSPRPTFARSKKQRTPPHHDATDVRRTATTDIPTSIDAVIELLTEAGMMPERPRALLEAAAADPRATRLPLLKRLMEFVLHHDETAYLTRSRELGFLANTLLAGCSVQSRPFTPQEASDAAACICNLGLECWPARWPGATSQGASSPRDSTRPCLPTRSSWITTS